MGSPGDTAVPWVNRHQMEAGRPLLLARVE